MLQLVLAIALAQADAGAGAPDAGATPEQQEALDELEGFQKARWGMTHDMIESLFPEAEQLSERFVQSNETVAGKTSAVTFEFLGRKLASVSVRLRGATTMADGLGACSEWRRLLVAKYGPPASEGQLWMSTAKKPATFSESDIGAGRLVLRTKWAGAKTKISLTCRGWKKTPFVNLDYYSAGYDELQQGAAIETEKKRLEEL